MKVARIVWLVPALLEALACSSASDEPDPRVGVPCLPSVEADASFSGFSLVDVSIASGGCDGAACLVNHFQGRVSCPYGQTAEDVDNLPAGDPARCRVPGTTDQPIEVPVDAQRIYRNARDTVYCSCRCDGPDPGAEYCTCPSGYECASLIAEYGLPYERELAGSYCVKHGTVFNPQRIIPPDVCNTEDAFNGRKTAEGRYSFAEVCGNGGENP